MAPTGCRLVVMALMLLAVLGAGPAAAGDANPVRRWLDGLPFHLTGEVEVGGQYVTHRGNSYVFDEYRDLDSMPIVPNLYLLGEDKQRRGYVEMGGTNLNRTDAYYFANVGRYNYYRFFFEFDRLPHVLANNAQTIYDEPTESRFTVRGDAASVLALNNALNGATAATRATVVNQVNARLRSVDLGFQTDTARMGASWLVTPSLELGVSYAMTDRDGRVPLGTVIGSPGSNVVELPIPRNERYHEVKAGAEYVRDLYQVRLNYTFSAFENSIDAVDWENPCGAGAGGCRNPSGLGRYSTMPDNFAHTVSLAAGYSLPWWNTRFTAAGSYGFWRQDDTFLPYHISTTGNSTLEGATSTDGEMHVGNLNLGLSTRPARDVSVRLRYRLYDLQNQTPHHAFGAVLAGSSDALAPGALGTARATEPYEYRKQNAGADVSWRVVRPITLRAGYEYERWDRPHEMREVADTNEHIFKAGADIKPWSWLQARFTYSHGVRTIGAGEYEPHGGNATSLPQLRKFDESDRTRDKGDVYVQVTPIDTVSLGGTFYIQNDGYWNTDFGLWDSQAYGFSGDVSWAPTERLGLFAGYARDVYRYKLQNCFIGSPTVPADALPGSLCSPLDIFFVKPKDTLDSVNVGASYVVIPAKLDVSLGYRFAFGKSQYDLSSVPGAGPVTAASTNPLAGEPGAVPDVENRFHVFNVVGRFFLTQNIVLKLGYQYERYEEQDFTTDAIQPSLAAVPGSTAAADIRSIVLGATHPSYEAHIVAFSVGFRF
jgi:MtrB/PioB family decaheme-associated outer membrane protein